MAVRAARLWPCAWLVYGRGRVATRLWLCARLVCGRVRVHMFMAVRAARLWPCARAFMAVNDYVTARSTRFWELAVCGMRLGPSSQTDLATE